jgi:YD repeat-containing protein
MKKLLIIASKILFAIFYMALFSSRSNAIEISYTYDGLNRLTSAVVSEGTNRTTITYTYDAVGNVTSGSASIYIIPLCPQCSQDPVNLDNVEFSSTTNCQCMANYIH